MSDNDIPELTDKQWVYAAKKRIKALQEENEMLAEKCRVLHETSATYDDILMKVSNKSRARIKELEAEVQEQKECAEYFASQLTPAQLLFGLSNQLSENEGK